MEKQEKTNTPKWLRRLEKESWQAELLVSGLSLYGSLQLPQISYWLIDMLIDKLPFEQYLWGYMIAYLSLLGISILSTFFIIHLILRAYWIGLIGLNSVYPNGYKIKNKLYTEEFTRRFTSLLPAVPDSIKKIDDTCSTLFSGAFAFLMMYGSIALVAVPIIFFYNWASEYVPGLILNIPFYLIGLLLVFLLILTSIRNVKFFKESKLFQECFFYASVIFGRLNVFFKPTNQILMTFSTNSKGTTSNFILTITFVSVAALTSMSYFDDSNIHILTGGLNDEKSFYSKNRAHTDFYEEFVDNKRRIVSSIIPSEKIDGNLLRLFVPIMDNEDFIRDSTCAPYESDPNKSWVENKRAERENNLPCYASYHKVYVNDSLYQVDFLKHQHINKGEFGLLTYIPTQDFKIGKNILRVEKIRDGQGTIYLQTEIPFWFAD